MRSDLMVPSELEGTDYLLSSTMRLEDSFLQILDKHPDTENIHVYQRKIIQLWELNESRVAAHCANQPFSSSDLVLLRYPITV
ncbi:jg10609 [Pararge aegeria aegeria]|uniref:Jg10609 protein n=1 Tax=Pararge aegeria aegeria TaxID=348720 RepID=A0A8S4RZT4_9NEOP|nr:jg10609 [Pararge aegeria aegeria]